MTSPAVMTRLWMLLLFFFLPLFECQQKRNVVTPTGAIFASMQETSIDEQMFENSIQLVNTTSGINYSQLADFNHVAFLANTENVDFANSYQISNAVCSQLSAAGVTSVFSTAPNKASDAILRSFSEQFQVPYISASHYFPPSNSKKYQFSVTIRPKYIDAILALRTVLAWKKFTYIVDGDEGITRIKELLRSQEATEFDLLLRHMEPNQPNSVDNMLRNISNLGETNIMIDCSIYGTFVFFNHAFDMQMILPSYNYVVVNLASTMALAVPSSAYMKYTKGGGNITGLFVRGNPPSIMNYYSNKPPQFSMKEFSTMLTSDSIDLLKKAWESLILSTDFPPIAEKFEMKQDSRSSSKSSMSSATLVVGDRKNCGGQGTQETSLLGQTLVKYIKKTKFQGITGNVEFNEKGERVNMGIELVQLSQSEKVITIAHWNDQKKTYEMGESDSFQSSSKKTSKSTKHIIITSILEPPFLMIKEEADEEGLTGNQIYEGYCKDLVEKLAADLGFTYEIRQVKDGEYGAELKKANETEDGKPQWNGMIGEVMRGEADLAIAPLTINANRQRVVAFTKPFMNIGISIMIKKPQKELPGPLSFLDPFSNHIWFGIIIAYCGLSLGLFIVARFSPSEWQDISGSGNCLMTPDGGSVEKTNDFSLYNSMWFSLGALMQQGTDIAPRAPASRIVGGVWWFFTLIIISSYTANLAAFLTVETMIMPINNADELVDQKEIAYGTRRSGSTKSFFMNSQIDVYKRMWDYMSANFDNVMLQENSQGIEKVRSSNGKYAFLIESAMNEYISQQKPCDTMKVGPNLDSKGYGIAAEYDSTIIKNITLRILKYQEDGALERMKTTWWIDKGECGGSFSSTNTDNTNSLGLSSVAGIFYILISGLILAMISAVAEYFYKSYRLHKAEKKSMPTAFKQNVKYMVTGVDESSQSLKNLHNGMPMPAFDSLPFKGQVFEKAPSLQRIGGVPTGTIYGQNEYWNKSNTFKQGLNNDSGSQYSFTSFASAGVAPLADGNYGIQRGPMTSQQQTPKKFTDV